jgi:hypothetical protein
MVLKTTVPAAAIRSLICPEATGAAPEIVGELLSLPSCLEESLEPAKQ